MSTRTNGPLGIAVIGAGYWGPNLVRNFGASPDWDLRAGLRPRPRAGAHASPARTCEVTDSVERVLDDPRIDAVAIATPARTHHGLALPALERRQARARGEAAGGQRRDAAATMVGPARGAGPGPDGRPHLLLHAGRAEDPRAGGQRRAGRGALRRLGPDQPRAGAARHRRASGTSRRTTSSILDFVLPGGLPTTGIGATGADPIGAGRACVGYLTLPLPDDGIAHVHVNWLSPTKIRQMVIGGSRRTLVWDDLNPQQRLQRLRPRRRPRPHVGRRRRPRAPPPSPTGWATPGPRRCPSARPSASMVGEFAAAIREGRPALTDGRSGLRVLAVLEPPRSGSPSVRRRRTTPRAGAGGSTAGAPPGRIRHERARDGGRPMTALAGATALVTGGAGTIGSTLVDQLLDAGVGAGRVLDNFVRGRRGQPRATRSAQRPRSSWSTATSATATWCTT